MIKTYIAAPAIDESAISCLFNNLDIILSNKKYILCHSKYRNIHISGMFFAGLYVGMHDLYLGDLLSLWDKTEWHNGNKYYMSIIGSPLSGANQAKYWNIELNKLEYERYFNGKLGWCGLGKPAFDYLQHNNKCRIKSNNTIYDLIRELNKKIK